jgi:anti-sigma regulatory factor (Ser/Thr protein kinase)
MTTTAVPVQSPTVECWPLASRMPVLCATLHAPRSGRMHVRVQLAAWGLDAMQDVAETIASELITNAVQASTDDDGDPLLIDNRLAGLQLSVFTDGTRLLIRVWDRAPGVPVRREPEIAEEGGRGLLLVDRISSEWGWEPVGPGKVVWALLEAA